MPKKSTKKRKTSSAKKTSAKTSKKSSNIDRALAQNFISLQKVMVNLSVKFDELTKKMSELLNLFEVSAKSLAKKDFEFIKQGRDDREILEKLNSLLDQNKTIAKGLSLMHERIPTGQPQPIMPRPQPMPIPQQNQPPQNQPPQKPSTPAQPQNTQPQPQKPGAMAQEQDQQQNPQSKTQGYQKSISINAQKKNQNPKQAG